MPAWDLTKDTFREWRKDNAPRFAAAMAYYTLFSLAPLLVVAVLGAGLVLGEQAAQGQLQAHVQSFVGAKGADAIGQLVQQAGRRSTGALAGALSLLVLLWGASGVFRELQSALNTMWEAPPRGSQGLWHFIRARLLPFILVLSVGALVLVLVLAAAAVELAGRFLGDRLPIPSWALQAANALVSVGVLTLLFAVIYMVLPDLKIAWREVWKGALVTAVLFTLGKTALGLYLGRTTANSFGAAGSVMVLLIWLYWSAQLFFLGAEFTQVYARSLEQRRGSGG